MYLLRSNYISNIMLTYLALLSISVLLAFIESTKLSRISLSQLFSRILEGPSSQDIRTLNRSCGIEVYHEYRNSLLVLLNDGRSIVEREAFFDVLFDY